MRYKLVPIIHISSDSMRRRRRERTRERGRRRERGRGFERGRERGGRMIVFNLIYVERSIARGPFLESLSCTARILNTNSMFRERERVRRRRRRRERGRGRRERERGRFLFFFISFHLSLWYFNGTLISIMNMAMEDHIRRRES